MDKMHEGAVYIKGQAKIKLERFDIHSEAEFWWRRSEEVTTLGN